MKFSFHGIILSAVLWTTTLSASQQLEIFQGQQRIQIDFDGAVSSNQLAHVLQPRLDEINRTASELRDGYEVSQKGLANSYLIACKQWQEKSQGNFSCHTGYFEKIWQTAQLNNELPDRAELRKQASRLITNPDGADWFADDYWYSWVLDELMETLKHQHNIQLNWISIRTHHLQRLWKKFDQGKDINYINFFNEKLSNNPIVENRDAPAIAIIEHNPNAFLRKVNHYWLSRVINPKTGWPVEYPPSIMVTANNLVTAQAVAEAVLVKSGPDAITWANSIPNVSVLLVTETGKVFLTDNWHKPASSTGQAFIESNKKLVIQYEIPALHLAEYRRPYFSIWISGAKNNSLRSLQLIGDDSRWLRELRHWWRIQGRHDDALIDGLAGATVKPGRYEIFWNGRNDQGLFVKKGNYVLHIEIAREHGGHEELSIPFVWDDSTIEISATGKQELGRVSLQFTPD